MCLIIGTKQVNMKFLGKQTIDKLNIINQSQAEEVKIQNAHVRWENKLICVNKRIIFRTRMP